MSLSLVKPNKFEEYTDIRRWLGQMKPGSSQWGDAWRWYCENDLFFLVADVLSFGKTVNAEAKDTLLFHNQFYLDWCRQIEWQLESGGGSDHSCRRSGKSTLRTIASNIQRMIAHPSSAGCLFSYQRKAARKHIRVIKAELESNKLLQILFDDVLWPDPLNAARVGETVWSMEDGLCVKRKVNRKELTMEFNAFMDGTPTGGGYDRLDFDDVEDHKALGNEEQLEKLMSSYDSAINLLTPNVFDPPIAMFTNTFYSDLGLANRVYLRYVMVDARKVRKYPGEDLTRPGDGPLGGTANFPFTSERLHRIYDEMSDKREYAVQICCDFLVGESRRFKDTDLLRYPEAPEKAGRGRNVYICIDPSRGLTDPMAIWVWGLGADKKALWLDASVKKLDPALPAFYDEIFLLAAKWGSIGRLVEIRVEQFGQSTFAEMIAKDLQTRNFYVPVLPCADNIRTRQFATGKRDREFERWAKPTAEGTVLIPTPVCEGGIGLVRPDERGQLRDLVDYFLKYEWAKFPKPITDNMLDAGALLWEPEERTGRALQYPATSFKKRLQKFAGQKTSWMSMG